MMFDEVNASCLMRVSFDGKVISGKEYQYNKTGYVIHGNIYKHRKDINSIFHLHTHAGIAVSCDNRGLMLVSQFALHFYKSISYHPYNSLELDPQNNELIRNLGKNYCMFLENHGTITTGRTIQEAMFYTHHLEHACRVQILTNSLDKNNIREIDHKTCQKSHKDLISFEENLGQRDWKALIRELERHSTDYKL